MKKQLKEMVTQIRGVSYKPTDIKSEIDGIPILRANNIQDDGINLDELVYIDSKKVHEEQYLKKGDIVICASSGSKNLVGKAATYNKNEKASFGAFCKVVRVNESENLCKEFVQQYFQSKLYRNAISELSIGANINNIKTEHIDALEINVPSLPEQQKIAAHLDSIQSAIDNKKQQLQQLDELVKSKFVEMFGETPVESGKWKVETLGNLCSIGGGYAFKSDKFLEDGIPVLRIGNINAGFFRPTNMVYWKNDDKLERYAIYPGDLVMSLTGTAGKEDYGNICVLGDEYPKYFLNQRNAKFTDLKNLNKLYLAHLLKLQDMKQKLTGLNHGVRQGNILNKDLENLEIPVPPIELQNKFAEYVQKIDSAKAIIKTQLVELQELLDSKMDEYFGE